MLRARLTRIQTRNTDARSIDLEGECYLVPEIGSRFVFFAPGVAAPGFRLIKTSEILDSVYYPKKQLFVFETLNSSYELEILESGVNLSRFICGGTGNFKIFGDN